MMTLIVTACFLSASDPLKATCVTKSRVGFEDGEHCREHRDIWKKSLAKICDEKKMEILHFHGSCRKTVDA